MSANLTIPSNVRVLAGPIVLGGGGGGGGGNYTLPVATATVLGGVKEGANVAISATGVLSVNLPAAANLSGYMLTPNGTTEGQIITFDGHNWGALDPATFYVRRGRLEYVNKFGVGFRTGDNGLFATGISYDSNPYDLQQYLTKQMCDRDYSIIGHTHPTGEIDNLDVLLAGKANLTHNHTQAEVDGLESNLTTIKASLADLGNKTAPANATAAGIVLPTGNITVTGAGSIDVNLGGYIPKPATATANQVLTYNGTSWLSANAAVNYSLPIASATTLGGVKAGGNVTVTGTGIIDVNLGGYIPKPATITSKAGHVLTYDGTNWLSANAAVSYSLPIANATTLGGVKAGGNVTIDGTGLLSVNMPTGYTLPIANATTLGGIKQGANTTIAADGAISVILPAAANLTGYLTQNTANTLYQPIGGGLQTLTDAASIAWALDPSKIATVTLGGSRTLANPTNKAAGGTYLLIVKQDATGTRTLAYGTEYKFPSGIKPLIPVTANSVTILTFVTDGVNMYGLSQGDFK